MLKRILIIFIMTHILAFGIEKVNTEKGLELGKYKGKLMEIGIKKEYEDKINRIKSVLAANLIKNKEWFNDYVKANEGKELPWNEKFGVSKDEYEFLKNINSELSLISTKDLDIDISSENGFINFVINDEELMSNSIKFDLKNNKAFIGNLEFNYDKTSNNNEQNGLLGIWQGDIYVVKFQEITDLSTLDVNKIYGEVSLTIGSSNISKKFLYLKGTLIIEKRPYKVDELIFFDD